MRTPELIRDNDCPGSPRTAVLVREVDWGVRDGLRVGQAGQLRGRRQRAEAGGTGAAGARGSPAAADGEAEVQHAGLLEGNQQGHGVHRGLHVPQVSRCFYSYLL